MSQDREEAPLFDDATPWETAQTSMEMLGLGDGLPVVVPTRARLSRMLQGQEAPEAAHGLVPPLMGELSVAAVAYNCVLAGCRPAELAVVFSAVAATLEAGFNLLGIATTTGTPTVAVLVHGPAVEALGMNSGTNCLGPGNRANACIGRAVRLVLQNVGGARPGIGDMATMGQPGKYTFCFAEGAHPLLPSLAVRRGLAPARSAVTVIGVSGTLEVLPESPAASAEAVLRPALAAMRGGRRAGDGGKRRPSGEQFLLLPAEMADVLRKGRWDLAAMQGFLWQDGKGDDAGWPIARSADDIQVVPTGGPGVKMTCLVPWGGGTLSMTRPVSMGTH